MKIENWLYFRNVTDEDNDDGDTGSTGLSATSLCIPASSIGQITPYSDTAVRISFESVALDDHPQVGRGNRNKGRDNVILNTTQGKTAEVIKALVEAIAGTSKSNDGFIVIADDVVTNTANESVAARYLHPDIISCDLLQIYKTEQGQGMHEYYETISPAQGTSDSTNDVVGSLSISLPPQCILLEAALNCFVLAENNTGLVALEYHSAAIADDAASAGTEWVGADVAGNKSIPDADLDIGSGGILNDNVHSGSVGPIDRSTALTIFHVTAQEDMSGMTGTPRVGVYIKWWGGPAVALNA